MVSIIIYFISAYNIKTPGRILISYPRVLRYQHKRIHGYTIGLKKKGEIVAKLVGQLWTWVQSWIRILYHITIKINRLHNFGYSRVTSSKCDGYNRENWSWSKLTTPPWRNYSVCVYSCRGESVILDDYGRLTESEGSVKQKKKQYRYLGRIIKALASQCLASVVSVAIIPIPS